MRKVNALAILAVIFCLFSTPASAWVGTGKPANDPQRPSTWSQYYVGSGYHPGVPLDIRSSNWDKVILDLGENQRYSRIINDKPNGRLIAGPRSCSQWSFTSLLVRSGAKPRGYFYTDFRKDVHAIVAAGKAFPIVADGKVFQASDSLMSQGFKNITGGSLVYEKSVPNISVSQVKKYYEQGYFMSLLVDFKSGGGHWITVDYFDGDTLKTIDSGAATNEFPGGLYNSTITLAVLAKRADGKTPDQVPKADEGSVSPSSQPSAPQSSAASLLPDGGTISVKDLDGMPPATKGQVLQMEQASTMDFDLPDPGDLSTGELSTIQDYQEQTKVESVQTWTRGISAVFAFLGIALMLYSGSLLLAFFADSALGLGALLTGILTLGMARKWRPSRVLWVAAGVAVLSFLLLTGTLQSLVFQIRI